MCANIRRKCEHKLCRSFFFCSTKLNRYSWFMVCGVWQKNPKRILPFTQYCILYTIFELYSNQFQVSYIYSTYLYWNNAFISCILIFGIWQAKRFIKRIWNEHNHLYVYIYVCTCIVYRNIMNSTSIYMKEARMAGKIIIYIYL